VADLSELPPKERAIRYREMASQARIDAENTLGGDRDSVLHIAASWERLADIIEAMAARSIQAAEEAVQPVADEKLAALKAPPIETDET